MTYLDRIVDRHREVAASDGRPLDDLVAEAVDAPTPRRFREALVGDARPGRDRRDQAALAVEGRPERRPRPGDPRPRPTRPAARRACRCSPTRSSSAGRPTTSARARGATALPVLRKDFTVEPRDVADARMMGADAVLLIVAALDRLELAELHALATRPRPRRARRGPRRARARDRPRRCGATLVGVNQRDLVTFEVDHDRAVRVAGRSPTASSRSPSRASAARRRHGSLTPGYDAILVGEALVAARRPGRRAPRPAGASPGEAGPRNCSRSSPATAVAATGTGAGSRPRRRPDVRQRVDRPAPRATEYDEALDLIAGQMGVSGGFAVDNALLRRGPRSRGSCPTPVRPSPRWYVQAALVGDPSFRGRWLVEARSPTVRGISAVAPYDTIGYESPAWRGFVGDGEPRVVPGLPGEWVASSTTSSPAKATAATPGLPPEVVGCMPSTLPTTSWRGPLAGERPSAMARASHYRTTACS